MTSSRHPGSTGIPVASTRAGTAGLEALVRDPEHALIGLDLDGTLAPFVAEPAAATVHPDVPELLRRLCDQVATVAVVTGRPALTARSLLGLDAGGRAAPANFAILGQYGFETWTPASGVARGVDAAGAGDGDVVERVHAARAALPGVLERHGAPPGTFVEDKDVAVAVHVRRTADPPATLELLREPVAALAAAHGLRFEPGKLVLELRPSGVDKGTALLALVAARGARAVLYVGDDLGDLAAFDALQRLRERGLAAVGICSGPDDVPELRARADLVVEGPSGVVDVLQRLSAGLAHSRGA